MSVEWLPLHHSNAHELRANPSEQVHRVGVAVAALALCAFEPHWGPAIFFFGVGQHEDTKVGRGGYKGFPHQDREFPLQLPSLRHGDVATLEVHTVHSDKDLEGRKRHEGCNNFGFYACTYGEHLEIYTPYYYSKSFGPLSWSLSAAAPLAVLQWSTPSLPGLKNLTVGIHEAMSIDVS